MPRELRPCPRCDAAGQVQHNPDPTRPPTIIVCPDCTGKGSRLMYVYVMLHELHGRRASARA